MAERMGPARPAAVCRELTKRFEETRRDRLDALAALYADSGPPRGEVVVVVGPPPSGPEAAAAAIEPEALDDRLRTALSEGLGTKAAAAIVAAETGLARRDLYRRALRLHPADPDTAP